MDDGKDKLRSLFRKVDDAFQELMSQPSSRDYNEAYQDARQELDQYLRSLKGSLVYDKKDDQNSE